MPRVPILLNGRNYTFNKTAEEYRRLAEKARAQSQGETSDGGCWRWRKSRRSIARNFLELK
jgi:hypothetical protein